MTTRSNFSEIILPICSRHRPALRDNGHQCPVLPRGGVHANERGVPDHSRNDFDEAVLLDARRRRQLEERGHRLGRTHQGDLNRIFMNLKIVTLYKRWIFSSPLDWERDNMTVSMKEFALKVFHLSSFLVQHLNHWGLEFSQLNIHYCWVFKKL